MIKQRAFLFTALALCAFFTVACSSSPSDKLADYPAVTAHFSEQETADLQTLLHLFEEEIGIQPDASPEAKAAGYAVFNKQLVDFMVSEGFKDSFLIPLQTRTKLLDVLRLGTFRSIWFTGTSTPRDTCDCSITSHLAIDGKFLDFLAHTGKELPQLAELHTDIARSGGLSPAFAATVFQNFEQLNTQDPRVQLIYVIGCLSWGMEWGE